MAFTEDLAPYFDTANGFAVAATFDGASPVSIIFDNAFLEGAGISGSDPVALGKASDFPEGSTIGKTLQIGATTWTIRDRQPRDDGALVVLQLEQ